MRTVWCTEELSYIGAVAVWSLQVEGLAAATAQIEGTECLCLPHF